MLKSLIVIERLLRCHTNWNGLNKIGRMGRRGRRVRIDRSRTSLHMIGDRGSHCWRGCGMVDLLLLRLWLFLWRRRRSGWIHSLDGWTMRFTWTLQRSAIGQERVLQFGTSRRIVRDRRW